MNLLEALGLPAPVVWLLAAIVTLAALAAALHALLSKRDPRSALGWIAVCLLFPAIGPGLYYVFGINRIRTRAKLLHADDPDEVRRRLSIGAPPGLTRTEISVRDIASAASESARHRESERPLVRLSETLSERPFVGGNSVDLLCNGEQAFPAMLEAIAAARQSVYLATYIFDTDDTGQCFADALAAAKRRGVRVRVLVDGVGERYSRPIISKLLKRNGVPVARFLPPRLFPPQLHVNLRNHRKILTVDGATAFTGGMNIGDRHLVQRDDPDRVVDVHFRLRGPVVAQIEEVFVDDWEFVTGERLPLADVAEDVGESLALTVVDGPNEDLDKLSTLLIGAVATARQRIWIVTPYFLPPRDLIAAIKTAVLCGVDVTVILPGHNNLPYVHWASRNTQWELLQWGVRVYYQPPPFAHTKLLLIDDDYAQFGSANIDPRSLRLNFELTVEVYDPDLVQRLARYATELIDRSRVVSFDELDGRPLWQRTRDAAAWLFSPYL